MPSTSSITASLAACLAACGTPPPAPSAPRHDAAKPAPVADAWTDRARAQVVAVHMRDHYDDLRVMERHLVENDLDTVRDYAFSIAIDKGDPELDTWNAQLAAMRAAAYSLGTAEGQDEACRREPRLAAKCGECHRDSGAVPELEVAPLPPDEPNALARMDRHQWAADRLWQAMITSEDRAWRDGLDVLAATPLPTVELTTVAAPDAGPKIRELGLRMQRLAKQARTAGSLEDRATQYGEILVVCSRCHALAK